MKAYPCLADSGQDASADHFGVGVELQVIQQQTGGQQHGCGVCCVAVGDALPCVSGALRRVGNTEQLLIYTPSNHAARSVLAL